MADFATVAELEAFMGTSGLGARGTAMLGYASAQIRRYTGQDLEVTTGRQEEFAAAPRRVIELSQVPVTAVTEVTIDGTVFTDFEWDRDTGTLYKNDYTTWDTGPIVVTYDSGYAADSDEMVQVEQICLEVAARALAGNQSGGFEQFGSEVAELRGAAPAVFLTEEEQRQLDGLIRLVAA